MDSRASFPITQYPRGEWLTEGGTIGGKQRPNLPSFVWARAGAGSSLSALSKNVYALGSETDCSGQAHPQETTLLRSLLSWFRILQNKQGYPVGWDSSYSLLIYIADFTGKSDPTAAGAKRGNYPSRWDPSQDSQLQSTQGTSPGESDFKFSAIPQINWGPKRCVKEQLVRKESDKVFGNR